MKSYFRALLSKELLALLLFVALAPAASAADPDLPGASANLETIEAGSLVIPMDTTNQAVVAPFNLKAYGLANHLLQNEIPLKWAIKAGKAKDDTDFTVSASRILPDGVPAASVAFAGGPFIVPSEYAADAETLAIAFGNDVAVFRTEADVSVDVRYTLTFKPFINISDVSSSIHTKLLAAAGIPPSNYVIADPATLTADTCATIHLEPHRSAPAPVDVIDGVAAFLGGGGNFLAQCQAVEAFEGEFDTGGKFLTSDGVVVSNVEEPLTFLHPDMPFSQIVGALVEKPGGSEQDFTIGSGSFENNGHVHAQNVDTNHFAAASGKMLAGVGGNFFYLGGHEYKGKDLEDINGLRMALNAIFVPADRPQVCGFDFGLVAPSENLDITKTDGVDAVDPGSTVTYTIVVSNVGTDDADGAVFTDPTVDNFTATSVTCGSPTGGAVCPAVLDTTVALMQGAGITIPTFPADGSVTFTVSGTAGESGFITNIAYVTGPADTTESAADTDSITSVDLNITKDANATFVAPGGAVVYTIVVSNDGPDEAVDAVLNDPAVANLTVDSVTCGNEVGGAVCPAGPGTTVSLLQNDGIVIPSIPAGGSVTFTVNGTAGASGIIVNTASVNGPGGAFASSTDTAAIVAPGDVPAVPALDARGLALLIALVTAVGVFVISRRGV